jgi:hypothetical protein
VLCSCRQKGSRRRCLAEYRQYNASCWVSQVAESALRSCRLPDGDRSRSTLPDDDLGVWLWCLARVMIERGAESTRVWGRGAIAKQVTTEMKSHDSGNDERVQVTAVTLDEQPPCVFVEVAE